MTQVRLITAVRWGESDSYSHDALRPEALLCQSDTNKGLSHSTYIICNSFAGTLSLVLIKTWINSYVTFGKADKLSLTKSLLMCKMQIILISHPDSQVLSKI